MFGNQGYLRADQGFPCLRCHHGGPGFADHRRQLEGTMVFVTAVSIIPLVPRLRRIPPIALPNPHRPGRDHTDGGITRAAVLLSA